MVKGLEWVNMRGLEFRAQGFWGARFEGGIWALGRRDSALGFGRDCRF